MVREYLETGDESKRIAARAAAWNATIAVSAAVWTVSSIAARAAQRDKFLEMVDYAFDNCSQEV